MAERFIVEGLSDSAAGPFTGTEEGEPVSDEELLMEEPLSRASRGRGSGHAFDSGASKRFAALPLAEGDVVAGRYRVERVLGRDGHELVLSVRHVELDERALMRVLLPEASVNADAVARFRRGARRSLEHRSEHTERVLDFGRLSGGNPYKIVELPRGPSLDDVLKIRGELAPEEVCDIAITICEALCEVHAARGVFRNLSPANVYLERRQDGTSFARLVSSGGPDDPSPLRGDELTIFGTAASVESLSFASPEQFRNPSAVDQRADIWSLGAIAYQLLTGRPPFPADTSVALISMIAADDVEQPSSFRADVHPELDETVLRCLQKNPAERPQTVGELVELLVPFATDQVQAAAERVRRVALRSLRPSPSSPPSERPSGAGVPTSPPFRTAPRRPSARDGSLPPPLSPRAVPRSVRSGPQPDRAPARGRRGTLMVALGAAVGAIAALTVTMLGKPPLGEPTTQTVMAATTAPVEPSRSTAAAGTNTAPAEQVVTAGTGPRTARARPRTAPSPRGAPMKQPESSAESVGQAPAAPVATDQPESAALFDGID